MIRFRCVRCQHSLKIRAAAAGKKLHCPVCYHELTVPAESTIKAVDPSQLYTTDEKPVDVREMRHRHEFASLRCKICSTNIAVRKEQIGEAVICPDCETTMIVPPEIAQKFTAVLNDALDKIMLGLGDDSTKDVYGFHDGNSASSEDETGRFPVYCKLCHAILYATDGLVGTELTCPDCDTKTVVPPSPRKEPASSSVPLNFEGSSTFGIAEDVTTTREPLIPVVCGLCKTLMYAGESQIGEFKTCPDCGRQTEIKAVPKAQRVQPEISGEGYALRMGPPSPRPAFRTLTDYRYVDGSLDREYYGDKPPEEPLMQRHPQSPQRYSDEPLAMEINQETLRGRRIRHTAEAKKFLSRRRPLPQRPLTDGLLAPIFTWRVMVRILTTTGLACFTVLVGYVLAELFILSLGLVGLGLIFWACVQLNFCWSVFQFSTDGNNEFEEWAEFSLAGAVGFLLWILCLCTLAATPGYFLSACLSGDLAVMREMADEQARWVNEPSMIIQDYILMRLSHWIIFPFFFLSCMEAGSYFSPVSWGTLRTFARYTVIWARFYALAALIILAPEIAFIGLFLFAAGFLEGVALSASFILLGFCGINFFSLLFFRLLGRLAWVLEESVRQEQDEEDE